MVEIHTHNEILKNSIEKHGLENFDFEILDKDVSSIDELNRLESYYAEKFDSYKTGIFFVGTL